LSSILKSPKISQEIISIGDKKSNLTPEEEAARIRAEIISRAKLEAQKIIDDAATESDKLLTTAESAKMEAEQGRDRVFKEAEDRGYREGMNRAQEEYSDKIKGNLEHIARLIDSARNSMEQMIISNESKVLNLAILIANKIVHKEIEQDSEFIKNTVREAIKRATEREKIIVRVNQEDLNVLKSSHLELMKNFDEIKKLSFEEDPRIERGGCIVETSAGSVDARIDRQISEAKDNLLG